MRTLIFVLYRDVKQEYRWKLWTGNNKIVADSGEGHKNKADMVAMVNKIAAEASGATVQDKT